MRQRLLGGVRFLLCTLGLFLLVLLANAKHTPVTILTAFSSHVIRNQFPLARYLHTAGVQAGNAGFTYYESKNFPVMEYVSGYGGVETVYKEMSEVSQDLVSEENGLSPEEGQGEEDVQTIGPVSFIFGETYGEGEGGEGGEATETSAQAASETKVEGKAKIDELRKSLSAEYLIKNFYIVDGTTSVNQKIFDVGKMLESDYGIQKDANVPQILIYHTHGASEGFKEDSGGEDGGIVGVGSHLAELLTNQYGYQVIHDKTKYDRINGKIDRNRAYSAALPAIRETLEKNPSIEVVIDLHRDGIGKGKHTYVELDGKKTAQIMFFNGMSRNKQGEIAYLENPYRRDNLAFSLQLKLAAMEKYPGLTKPIYLKGYRYNMHLAKRCLLIELGNQNNTKEEALNAMPALADVIDSVLVKRE